MRAIVFICFIFVVSLGMVSCDMLDMHKSKNQGTQSTKGVSSETKSTIPHRITAVAAAKPAVYSTPNGRNATPAAVNTTSTQTGVGSAVSSLFAITNGIVGIGTGTVPSNAQLFATSKGSIHQVTIVNVQVPPGNVYGSLTYYLISGQTSCVVKGTIYSKTLPFKTITFPGNTASGSSISGDIFVDGVLLKI